MSDNLNNLSGLSSRTNCCDSYKMTEQHLQTQSIKSIDGSDESIKKTNPNNPRGERVFGRIVSPMKEDRHLNYENQENEPNIANILVQKPEQLCLENVQDISCNCSNLNQEYFEDNGTNVGTGFSFLNSKNKGKSRNTRFSKCEHESKDSQGSGAKGTQSNTKNNKGVKNLSNLLKSLKFTPLFVPNSQLFSQHGLVRFGELPSLINLPVEIHFQICTFLMPKDIYSRLAGRQRPISISDEYKKTSAVVERRSKGRLFQAVSRLNGNQVMIRNVNIMISNAGQDDGVPTSILRELSFLSTLSHQNITKFIGVDIVGSNVQIVSPRCEYNLKEHTKQLLKPNTENPTKIPLLEVKKIFFQVLQGIDYLHHHGVIHRNMKIDNILVHEGIVKISDFGLSRLVTIPHIPYTPEDPKERERSGREARRLWYRAPELLFRKNLYSFEVDMWSLGCLFAEIVLNEPLFSGDSEIEQLFRIFRMLGSPNLETMSTLCEEPMQCNTFPKWQSIDISHICYPHSSPEFKQLKSTMIPNRQSGFQRLSLLGSVLGGEGMNLLNSLLQLNPTKRITAQKALHHPFFDDLKAETNCLQIIPLNCCHNEMSTCFYQMAMPACYLQSLYKTLHSQEIKQSPVKDYLNNQTAITENMRVILIDWLVDVSLHFEAQDETLHYCVTYIDRVLSIMEIERQKLQLVGVSCMKIADVFNERSREYYKQENAIEYAYITAEEYTSAQLIAMEKEVLKHLQFQLYVPTIMHFLKLLCTLLDTDSSVSIVAMFLADLLLMSYQATRFSASILAHSCLFLGFLSRDKPLPSKEQFSKLKGLIDHHSFEEFKSAVEFVRKFWHYYPSDPTTMNFESIYKKYVVIYGLDAHSIQSPVVSSYQLSQWIYS